MGITASTSPAATHHARHGASRYGPGLLRGDQPPRHSRAGRLGDRYTGNSYAVFVSGFADTAYDAVTIQSVSGHVGARLARRLADGRVGQTYGGTYRVPHGVITGFRVA
jgi:hypothetical protein